MKNNKEKIINQDAISLLKLSLENPELEIIAMVDEEIVQGDHFKWWRGSIRKSYIEEYYQDDERMYFKSEDIDELIEDYSDNIWVDDNDISTEDLEKEAEKRVKDIPWEKAIFMKISLP